MLLNKKKLRMLELFLSDYSTKATASEVARRFRLNQKSVYLVMEELERRSILSSETQGRNKLYFIKKENKEQVINFLCFAEHVKTLEFLQSHPNVSIVMAKIIPSIKGIAAIFGSYAKRTQKTDSDLDLFIAGAYDKEVLKTIQTFSIQINIKQQKTMQKNPLTEEVKKSHILVKGVEQFVREAWTS